MTEDPFRNKLLASEKTLWTGQPSRGLLLTQRDAFLIPFSLLWCGFAIFWTSSVTFVGAPGFFTLWGSLFVCIGLYFVIGRFLVDAWVRRTMYYAVTDRRILIYRPGPFSKFTALSIANLPAINLNERTDGRGTLIFGQPTPTFGNRGMTSMTPAFDPTPQFLCITDARRVFDLVQNAADRAQK